MVSQAIGRHETCPTEERQALRRLAKTLLQHEVRFIDSDEFRTIASDDIRLEAMTSESRPPAELHSRWTRDEPLACLDEALSDPLLSGAEERHEFRRMNYFKFAANRLKSAINSQRPAKRRLLETQRLLNEATAVRDRIIRANLRLVISNAGKYCSPSYNFEDLFSDGVLSLMEAVDKFDYSRGFRFSTYATHCIRRGFYRRIEKHQKQRKRFPVTDPEILGSAPDLADGDDQIIQDDLFVRRLLNQFDDCLSERERQIIEGRFGLGNRARPLTLLELSGELGICKERVRQVEHLAIEKLRTVAMQLMNSPADSSEVLSV